MTERIKKFIGGLTVLTVLCLAGDIAAAERKIVVVITQKLLAETKAGQAAATRLKAKKEEAQEKLDQKAKEIADLQIDLGKRAMVLNDEERSKARDEFERQQRDATRMKEDLERSLKKAEGEVLGGVNQFLTQVIVSYSRENGYDVVLDATVAVYFSDAADVTDELIEAADAAYKGRE